MHAAMESLCCVTTRSQTTQAISVSSNGSKSSVCGAVPPKFSFMRVLSWLLLMHLTLQEGNQSQVQGLTLRLF
jgi:hypothetical protein